MADNDQEMSRRGLGEAPVSQHRGNLVLIHPFYYSFPDDWMWHSAYVQNWQWQEEDNESDEPNEPMEAQPASQEAIKTLSTYVIQNEGKECSICLMDFKKNDVAKSTPCHHMFHELCILTWLNQNDTCPFCRYKLTTGFN